MANLLREDAPQVQTNTTEKEDKIMQDSIEPNNSTMKHDKEQYISSSIAAPLEQQTILRAVSNGAQKMYDKPVISKQSTFLQSTKLQALDLVQQEHKEQLAYNTYYLVNKIVTSCSGYIDKVHPKCHDKPQTRQNTVLFASYEYQEIQSSTAAQETYGHFRFKSLAELINAFIEPKKAFPTKYLSKSDAMTKYSFFLDIGSGFGFPNIMAFCLTGCKGLGIEIATGRIDQSNKILDDISKAYQVEGMQWKNQIEFKYENASRFDIPFTIDGNHITHVFAYNWAQKCNIEYMRGVIRRLNQTNFKLLAWSVDEKTTIEHYGLKARFLGQQSATTWGNERHMMYFYAKLEKEYLHQYSKLDNQQDRDSTTINFQQQVFDQHEYLQHANTSEDYRTYQSMMTSNTKAHITQESQHDDQEMKDIDDNGCNQQIANETSSIHSPNEFDFILSKRQSNQIQSSKQLQNDVRMQDIDKVDTLYDTQIDTQFKSNEQQQAKDITRLQKRYFKKSKEQEYLNNLINLLSKAEKFELEQNQTIPQYVNWKLKQTKLSIVNRKLKCTLTSMYFKAKGSHVSIFVGKMNNDSKDQVTVKIYDEEYNHIAKREDLAIKKIHAIKNSVHTFFVANKRYTNGSTDETMVFMDQYPCTLASWAQQRPPISVLKLQLHMLVRGVASCHIRGIAHRDLNTDNVALDNDLVPKIINLGMSFIYGEYPKQHYQGNRNYMAPEVMLKTMSLNITQMKYADCWSLGVTIYKTLYNELPFVNNVEWKNGNKTHTVPEIKVSQLESDCIKRGQLLPEDYIRANKLIRSLLEVNVDRRKTSIESMTHPFFDNLHYNQKKLPNVREIVQTLQFCYSPDV